MNILTDVLPTKIKVNNNIYNINYDFKTCINIILAFEDSTLTIEEQAYILIKNLYKEEVLEEDYYEAYKKGVKFLDRGEEPSSKSQWTPRTYSFKKDGNYIYSGIIQTSGIDLEKETNLHWWKFLSLFMDMSADCTFGELVYYRSRKNKGKLTKEEKEKYKEMKDLVSLEEKKEVSEARKRFFEELRN